jgi:GAF domain-containing protein
MADKSIAAALKGEAVIIKDISKDKRLQYPKEAAKEGIASILSIPIVFSSEILGVLRLYNHDVWEISERDVDSLLVLAEHIGLSLRYTRLLNALQSIKVAIQDLPLASMET